MATRCRTSPPAERSAAAAPPASSAAASVSQPVGSPVERSAAWAVFADLICPFVGCPFARCPLWELPLRSAVGTSFRVLWLSSDRAGQPASANHGPRTKKRTTDHGQKDNGQKDKSHEGNRSNATSRERP